MSLSQVAPAGSGQVRKKPQIPSLGPNLGKLGFTDLKMDDEIDNKDKDDVNMKAAPS